VALVRPSKSLSDLEPSSVKKKLKDRGFARNVSREDIARGAELLGLPLDEHIANVIASMRTIAADLGL
jgi:predicted hydrolase (HD superfamily)